MRKIFFGREWFFWEKIIFGKDWGMRTCAWLPPHILFFHFHTFFRREISVVLSVFCCSGVIFGLFRQSVCCVLFGVFIGCLCAVFWFRVCMGVCLEIRICFAGFVWCWRKWWSVSVNRCNLRMFRVWCLGYLGWNRGAVAHSGVMYPNLSYIFSLGFMRLTRPSLEKKTLITLMRPDGRAARRCFAFGKTCCRSRFGAANLIL